jgi:hypothetical protein
VKFGEILFQSKSTEQFPGMGLYKNSSIEPQNAKGYASLLPVLVFKQITKAPFAAPVYTSWKVKACRMPAVHGDQSVPRAHAIVWGLLDKNSHNTNDMQPACPHLHLEHRLSRPSLIPHFDTGLPARVRRCA